MKEMIKRMRKREEGFTLAELLIVVAIIAVLVAIAIPVFSSQMTKAEIAADEANARSMYGYNQTKWMTDHTSVTPIAEANKTASIDVSNGQTVQLKKGKVYMTVDGTNGVTVVYELDDSGNASMTSTGASPVYFGYHS